jgi:hypothetical protein
MAKKQLVPDTIQKQFNKLQFKQGQPVFFTWLGMKKYGHVIQTKQMGWGIMYTIQSEGTKYPCGVQIKTHKTAYTTGCILVDDTRSIDDIELERRIQSGHHSTNTEVFSNPRRPKDESGGNNNGIGIISKTNSRNSTKSNAGTTKDAVKPSSTRVRNNNSTKRAASKLDDAIQKQRDFLSGFVKKD